MIPVDSVEPHRKPENQVKKVCWVKAAYSLLNIMFVGSWINPLGEYVIVSRLKQEPRENKKKADHTRSITKKKNR